MRSNKHRFPFFLQGLCSGIYVLYKEGSIYSKSIEIHFFYFIWDQTQELRRALIPHRLVLCWASKWLCLLVQNEWRSASSQRRISSIPTSFSKWTNSALLFWAPATSCTVSRLRFHGNSVQLGTHGKAVKTERGKKIKFLLGRANLAEALTGNTWADLLTEKFSFCHVALQHDDVPMTTASLSSLGVCSVCPSLIHKQ